MAARGVDVAALAEALPAAAAHAHSPSPQPPPPPPPDAMDAGAGGDGLADALDAMQVEPPMQLVELAPAALPPLPPAAACLERAMGLYSDVLGRPAAEWGAAPTVSRVDAAFNAACACALRGAGEECARLLGALAAEGALTRAEVERDDDLAPLVPTPWMQSLLRGLPP